MLSVSNAWNNMFKNNLIGEGLIKFDIQDYGTLYKKDIFSYKFIGRNRFLCDTYPQYNATLVAIHKSDYLNFNNFIGKKVEIYYGFVVNGNEEYVKAQTLFIDDIEISDDGRKTTFSLKSMFAYLTTTLQDVDPNSNPFLFYQINQGGTLSYYETFSYYLYRMYNYTTPYTFNSSINKYIRFLPSKTTQGNGLQEIAFINCSYLKLKADGNLYIDNNVVDKPVNYPINILKYPHYSKMEQPKDVEITWFDPDNTDEYQKVNLIIDGYVSITYHSQPQTGYWGKQKINADNSSIFLVYPTKYKKSSSSLVLNNTSSISVHAGSVDLYYSANTNGNVSEIYVDGYQFDNFYNTENGKVSIFNINILDQNHADAIKARVSNYLKTQKYVELELRINPAYELLDQLYFENDMKSVIIEELMITFDKSFSGRIKGRYSEEVEAPIVDIDHYSDHDYSMNITNPNPFPVDLYIECSAGEIYIALQGGETIYMDDDHYPLLMGSFQAKAYQDLAEEVYCWFEDPNSGTPSDSTIILEAD